MSTNGAVKDQASAHPSGGVVRARSGTDPAHQGSGVPAGSTSVPATIRTPDPGSAASSVNTPYDRDAQALTRCCGRAS